MVFYPSWYCLLRTGSWGEREVAQQRKSVKYDESYLSTSPNTWYKKQEKKKKEEQEVQNTLTLKSGGKSYTRKCQQFQEYE